MNKKLVYVNLTGSGDTKKALLKHMTECQSLFEMLVSLSHEIRIPLTTIDGFTNLLLLIEEGKFDTNILSLEEALQSIKKASHHIGEIASAMSEYAEQLEQNNSDE
jgi:signal transduction histidine kinase